jgi:transcriptional regulator with XRE-family HTH domain
MSVISERFADELAEKEMRDAYLSAQTRTKITNQIRAIRNQRGWSQGQFAKILEKPQSNVSRLENREYGSFTLSTLFELASAFDVGLLVEFVPYESFLLHTRDLSTENLEVSPFSRRALDVLTRDTLAILKQGVSGAAAAAQNAAIFSQQRPALPSAPSWSAQNEVRGLAPAERTARDDRATPETTPAEALLATHGTFFALPPH